MLGIKELLDVLEIKKVPEQETDLVIESCIEFEPALDGLFICCAKNNLGRVIEIAKDCRHGDYCATILGHGKPKGFDALAGLLKINSYTQEFVDSYGSVQRLLDGLFGEEVITGDVEIEAELVDVEASPDSDVVEFVQIAEKGVQPTQSERDIYADICLDVQSTPADYVPAFTGVVMDSVDVANDVAGVEERQEEINSVVAPDAARLISQTGGVQSDVYNKVEESEDCVTSKDEVQLNQADEMMLILRGIAVNLGIAEFNDDEILSKEDLADAQKYVSNLSSATTREAFIGVFSMINTKEDYRAITNVLTKFIQYLNKNNITR